MANASMSGPFAVAQHEKDVSEDQTRLGLVFLLLGLLVSAVPVITPIGGLVAFVAAIFWSLDETLSVKGTPIASAQLPEFLSLGKASCL